MSQDPRRPALPTSIAFGDDVLQVPRQTLAVERAVIESVAAAQKIALKVDQANIELIGIQQSMQKLALSGDADAASLDPLTKRASELSDHLAQMGTEQTAARIATIAARLGETPERIESLIDLRELAAVEQVLVSPPPYPPSDVD